MLSFRNPFAIFYILFIAVEVVGAIFINWLATVCCCFVHECHTSIVQRFQKEYSKR